MKQNRNDHGAYVRKVQEGTQSYLIVQRGAMLWSPGGYREASNALKDAMLLTPPSTLRALDAGYRPVLHRSAGG